MTRKGRTVFSPCLTTLCRECVDAARLGPYWDLLQHAWMRYIEFSLAMN